MNTDPVRNTLDSLREQLKTLWSNHQALQSRPAWRLFPMHWAEFELRLLRLEELYLDGVLEPEAVKKAGTEAEEALQQLTELHRLQITGDAQRGTMLAQETVGQ